MANSIRPLDGYRNLAVLIRAENLENYIRVGQLHELVDIAFDSRVVYRLDQLFRLASVDLIFLACLNGAHPHSESPSVGIRMLNLLYLLCADFQVCRAFYPSRSTTRRPNSLEGFRSRGEVILRHCRGALDSEI